MKSILRILFATSIIFTAASCTKETPVPAPAPDHFTITAEIEQTRVSYQDSDSGLKQAWEVGDKLVGFYVSKINTEDINIKMNFTVASVDENGVAHLSTTDALPAEGTRIHLIYTGGQDMSFNNTYFSVSLLGQSYNTKLPALMSASADVTEQGLNFSFRNDCAIIEISELNGIPSGKTISQIKVDNVSLEGNYYLNSDKKGISASPNTPQTFFYSGEENWEVGIDNTIHTKFRFAVLPRTYAIDIVVTAVATDGSSYSITFPQKNINAGKCYRITGKTLQSEACIGDIYFPTFSKAVEYSNNLTEDHKIVLRQDITIASSDAVNFSSAGVVTLDLNGKTIDFTNKSYIHICEGTSFVLSDSQTGGTINCLSNYQPFKNDGTLTITGGNVNAGSSAVIYNVTTTSTATITGGLLTNTGGRSILNQGTLNIEDGEFRNTGSSPIIRNNYIANVSGGLFVAQSGNAVSQGYIDEAVTSITGGYFSTSTEKSAIDNDMRGTITISGGYFTNTDGLNAFLSDTKKVFELENPVTVSSITFPYLVDDKALDPEECEARIGSKYYLTIEEAVTALGESNYAGLNLLKDCAAASKLEFTKFANILDTEGHTLTAQIDVKGNAYLNIKGNGTVKSSEAYVIKVEKGGSMEVENCSIQNTAETGQDAVAIEANGEIALTGVDILSNNYGIKINGTEFATDKFAITFNSGYINSQKECMIGTSGFDELYIYRCTLHSTGASVLNFSNGTSITLWEDQTIVPSTEKNYYPVLISDADAVIRISHFSSVKIYGGCLYASGTDGFAKTQGYATVSCYDGYTNMSYWKDGSREEKGNTESLEPAQLLVVNSKNYSLGYRIKAKTF